MAPTGRVWVQRLPGIGTSNKNRLQEAAAQEACDPPCTSFERFVALTKCAAPRARGGACHMPRAASAAAMLARSFACAECDAADVPRPRSGAQDVLSARLSADLVKKVLRVTFDPDYALHSVALLLREAPPHGAPAGAAAPRDEVLSAVAYHWRFGRAQARGPLRTPACAVHACALHPLHGPSCCRTLLTPARRRSRWPPRARTC
jgi:hypothetical protein